MDIIGNAINIPDAPFMATFMTTFIASHFAALSRYTGGKVRKLILYNLELQR